MILCENPKIEIINADCMDYLSTYNKNQFDLAIIDPPYGINIASRGNLGRERGFNPSGIPTTSIQRFTKKDWDISAPNKQYFDTLIKISKNQVIWGANHFISKIPYDSSCWLIWDKIKSGNYADCELAWTSFKTAVKCFKWKWNGMLQEDMKNKEKRIHPTQKPIALYMWLLKNYSSENQYIIDTHLGSGSSAIAAFQCNCNFFRF